MAINSRILDGSGGNSSAKVTQYGQLVTAPLSFSTAYNATAGTANVAANLVTPQTNSIFVITGISLYANQNVSNVSDATVVIYEATAPDTTTVSKNILVTNMVRGDRVIWPSPNISVTEGKWVNFKTTDDDVYGTILGYYIKLKT